MCPDFSWLPKDSARTKKGVPGDFGTGIQKEPPISGAILAAGFAAKRASNIGGYIGGWVCRQPPEAPGQIWPDPDPRKSLQYWGLYWQPPANYLWHSAGQKARHVSQAYSFLGRYLHVHIGCKLTILCCAKWRHVSIRGSGRTSATPALEGLTHPPSPPRWRD